MRPRAFGLSRLDTPRTTMQITTGTINILIMFSHTVPINWMHEAPLPQITPTITPSTIAIRICIIKLTFFPLFMFFLLFLIILKGILLECNPLVELLRQKFRSKVTYGHDSIRIRSTKVRVLSILQ